MLSLFENVDKSAAAAFVAGMAVWHLVDRCRKRRADSVREHHSVLPDPQRALEADMSLFYAERTGLTETHAEARRLPDGVYGSVVRHMPVFCVDVVIRDSRQRVLLVHRCMEPVKGYWWWPGGRMWKGETFYASALRKAQQETGIEGCKPVALLGVYNTFFPTSSWDTTEVCGTHTVNAVVLVQAPPEAQVKLDETSDNHAWVSSSWRAAAAAGYDRYVVEQLRRIAEADL